MTQGATPSQILTSVAETLVVKQQYESVEDALWEIALSAVKSKASHYRQRIRRLERKYGVDFEHFTAGLINRAPPAEEDDWRTWRSAVAMLRDWDSTYQELMTLR